MSMVSKVDVVTLECMGLCLFCIIMDHVSGVGMNEDDKIKLMKSAGSCI